MILLELMSDNISAIADLKIYYYSVSRQELSYKRVHIE